MAENFAPDSYWQVLKERLGGMVPKNPMAGAAQAQPLDPNMRPGVPQEAMPANIDPNSQEFLRRQAIAQALLARQQQGQQQPMAPPQQALPPPMVNPRATPENPAGIQF